MRAIVAGVSALSGVLAGGIAVYSAIRGETTTPAPVSQPVTIPVTTLQISTTEIETAITQAVENVGPAVVTVVSQVSGQNVSGVFISSTRAYGLLAEWGAFVSEVSRNSPASAAGIQLGDIITQIGDVPLDADHSFINALFSYSPGEEIALQIMRGQDQIEVKVKLGETTPGS